ncbi:hypothetical protein [Streptomyces sp. NPDC012508]|uniref:hypothetical protein n=1 Tax=Streptomyces sp. NPDC012508 TaxID=3364837 RepID=UPI0036BECDF9
MVRVNGSGNRASVLAIWESSSAPVTPYSTAFHEFLSDLVFDEGHPEGARQVLDEPRDAIASSGQILPLKCWTPDAHRGREDGGGDGVRLGERRTRRATPPPAPSATVVVALTLVSAPPSFPRPARTRP